MCVFNIFTKQQGRSCLWEFGCDILRGFNDGD